MKTLYTISTILFFSINSYSQQFINGDLEGTPHSVSVLPDGWENVPYTDPACHADNSIVSTPDLTNETALLKYQISGTAQSGSTFMSGLEAGPDQHHEGIQQTLRELIPGQEYRINLYQAVVKQESALDTAGAWAVYVDEQLIAITDLSSSQLSYEDVDIAWDKRSVHFEATREHHTIKFLPWDDDNVFNADDQDGYLRMGIDNISLEEVLDMNIIKDIEFSLYPNPTLGPFTVDTDLLDYELIVMDLSGKTIFNRVHCNGRTNLEFDQRGVFMVMIKTETQHAVKRVVIQ